MEQQSTVVLKNEKKIQKETVIAEIEAWDQKTKKGWKNENWNFKKLKRKKTASYEKR